MVDVVAAHRPRVEGDRAHLRRPGDDRDLGGADLVGVAPRRELDPRGLHVVRRALRDALLEEGVAAALLARRQDDVRMHALRPALERRRPPRERAHDAVLDGDVVLDDVELRDRGRALRRGEDHAVGAAHAHLPPTGVDGRALARGHAEVLRERAPTCRPADPAPVGLGTGTDDRAVGSTAFVARLRQVFASLRVTPQNADIRRAELAWGARWRPSGRTSSRSACSHTTTAGPRRSASPASCACSRRP